MWGAGSCSAGWVGAAHAMRYCKRNTGARDLKPAGTFKTFLEQQQCSGTVLVRVQYHATQYLYSSIVGETVLQPYLHYRIHIIIANNMCSPYSFKLRATSPGLSLPRFRVRVRLRYGRLWVRVSRLGRMQADGIKIT